MVVRDVDSAEIEDIYVIREVLEGLAARLASEQGVTICQSSRVGSGRVVRAPSLVKRGWVAADNLVPWKARLLLALALSQTSDPAEIQRLFDTC